MAWELIPQPKLDPSQGAHFPRPRDFMIVDQSPAFDAELLRRYDVPGPRYTSYPTAPHFSESFGQHELHRAAAASNDDPIPRRLSLYLHVPFCKSPCFYCGCNRVITRDVERGERYATRLLREIEMLAPSFDRDRDVVQVHFGGGTPNFLRHQRIGELMDSLSRQFHFSRAPDRDFSIELDPRHVEVSDIAALAEYGFNRASLGVQDFDPEVQQAINRVQSEGETRAVLDACRRQGFRSLNMDLIYGLPKQTRERFARTLEMAIAMRPDRLAVYSYAHLPRMFRAQRQIEAADLPTPAVKLDLLQVAIEKLDAAGYRYVGMDHFTLPEDELALAQAQGGLHRNFMGYTTHADTDLIGFGVSAIAHIGDSFSQNFRDQARYDTAIDDGRLPVWRGLWLDDDDRLRADLIQGLMCQGEVDFPAFSRKHGIDFAEYFSAELARLGTLAADGLVEISPIRLRATSRGRMLLRIIAMCFDRYLHPGTTLQFSKAI